MSYKKFYEQFEKESYNLKVEDYEGRITVTKYDAPITYMSDEEKEARKDAKMAAKFDEKLTADTEPGVGDNLQNTWNNPATGKMEVIPEGFEFHEELFGGALFPKPKYLPEGWEYNSYFDNMEYAKMMIEDEEDAKKMSERLRNVRRTKQSIYELTKANKWDLFVTLTIRDDLIYKGENVRNNLSLAKEYIGKRINKLRERQGIRFGYVLVPEEHKKGGWHFHGLFKDIDGLELRQAIDPHTLKQIITKSGDFVYNLPQFESIGFTTATYVRDTVSAAKYVTKYITKSLAEQTSGKNICAPRACNVPQS